MDQHPVKRALPVGEEHINLYGRDRSKYRGFVIFLICCGLLLAAFAVSAIWLRRDDSQFGNWGSFWEQSTETDKDVEKGDNTDEKENTEEPLETQEIVTPIPDGAMPVRTMDLTYPSLGKNYLHNETPYQPNVGVLLDIDVSRESKTEEPLVLILHTHTSESYLPSGTQYLTEQPGDVTYSRDAKENVLAVGAVLCHVFNEKGITAIHCTVMHDEPTLSGSYDRSERTIRKYLETYPTIEYVIDLHRDAIVTSEGEYVRAATEEGDSSIAQVMAVIGTDGNGTVHPRWEENLALALQLREALNADGKSVCRPVSLRNASYHQEIVKHAILLEVGTGGNSVEEAQRAAVMVGEALSAIILGNEKKS